MLDSPTEPSGTPHYGQIKKDRPKEGLPLRTRETRGQPPLLGRSAGPHAAARRLTSLAKDEAATDHGPTDETFIACPNTERELPRGRGADDPSATTKHDRATVDAKFVAIGVSPAASRIARPSPLPSQPSPRQPGVTRLGNHPRGCRPGSRHGSHHANPRLAPNQASGLLRRSIASSARTTQEGDLPQPEHHGLCPARARRPRQEGRRSDGEEEATAALGLRPSHLARGRS
jgi:hypothetical protein